MHQLKYLNELFLDGLFPCRCWQWLSAVDTDVYYDVVTITAGRHRCSQCDYTVDRQHILDYHVKNVHAPGIAAPPNVSCPDDVKTGDYSDEEMSAEQLAKDVTDRGAPAVVKRRRTQAADMGQVMATYRCIVCGYSGHSVSATARHQLRHSAWSLPHRCRQCRYRATTRRLLTTHIKTQHDGGEVQSLTDHQLACSHCPHTSSSASQVASHKRVHRGARRRYQCRYCSYSVSSRRLVVQHRRLHGEDCRSLRCSAASCPFTCSDREQLTLHCRQHAATARRRLHACDRCTFSVDARNALLHHQRLHDQRDQ